MLIVILFAHCDPVQYEHELKVYIQNGTNKDIVLNITTQKGVSHVKTGTILYVDEFDIKDSATFKTEFIYAHPEMIYIIDAYLFNLSDTTYTHWDNIQLGNIYRGWYEQEGINSTCWLIEQDEMPNGDQHDNYSLTVSDALLYVMEKDYSMLERFPEYYRK